MDGQTGKQKKDEGLMRDRVKREIHIKTHTHVQRQRETERDRERERKMHS